MTITTIYPKITKILGKEGQQLHLEIRERLKSSIAEKYADHDIAMREKDKDAEIEISRMREETMLKMDFEEFMHELRTSTASLSDQELEASFERLKKISMSYRHNYDIS